MKRIYTLAASLIVLFTVFAEEQHNEITVYQSTLDSLELISEKDSGTVALYLDIIKDIYSVNPKSAETLTMQTLKLTEELEQYELKLHCHKFLLLIYLEMTLYDKAQIHVIEMEKLMNNHDFNQYKGQWYAVNGQFYYAQGIYEEALKYHKKALHYYEALDNRKSMSSVLNNIGSVYLEIQNYDSSLHYFNRALEIKRILGDKRALSYTIANLGSLFRFKGEFKKALKYLLEADEMFEEQDNKANLSLTKRLIGKTYLSIHQPENAKKYLNKAERLSIDTSSPKMLFLTYYEYGEYHSYLGDYQKAFEYQKKYADLKDSVYNFNKANTIQQIKDAYEKEKQEIALQLKEQKIQLIKAENDRKNAMNTLLISSLISLGIITCIIVFYLRSRSRRDRLIHEQSKQIQALKLSNLTRELEQKNRELTTNALDIIKKNEALAEIKSDLNGLESTSDQSVTSKIKSINNLVNKSFDTDKNWTDFKMVFEQVHSDFFKKLGRLNPALSPAEIKLCTLLKLNFSSKEISDMLGISTDSVKTSRSRLRKKLQLKRETNLVEFMISL
ncbi:MAG: tetratricopeptide repeat protein [Bacteroidota bacterium]